MTPFLLLALVGGYQPNHWSFFPPMDEVRCVSSGPSEVYVAVPLGVYVLQRNDLSYIRAITAADGLDGTVRLCAFNPGRNSLIITTSTHVCEYLRGTGRLTILSPPFSDVRSIGIAPDAVWFETESGFFNKHRVADEYVAATPPAGTRWYGRLDTLEPRDFIFLTPYFITDDQLFIHRMTHVYPEPGGRRLLVSAEGHGLVAYNLRTGFVEKNVRFGPPSSPVRRIQAAAGGIWLHSDGAITTVSGPDKWRYLRTAGCLPLPSDDPLLSRELLNLALREPMPAMLKAGDDYLIGTDRGLYLLGPNGRLTALLTSLAPVNAIMERRDTVVVGTSDGLYILLDDTLARIDDPYARTDWGVYSMARTADGTTWMGTLGGLLSFDAADTWRHISPPGFDMSRPARALATADSLVFVGDRSRLLVLDHRTGDWSSFDSLFASDIIALATHNGALWAATHDLVARFDYRRGVP